MILPMTWSLFCALPQLSDFEGFSPGGGHVVGIRHSDPFAGSCFGNQDVGNWACTLGMAALFVEGLLVAVAAYAISLRPAVSQTLVVRNRRSSRP